MIKSNNSTGNTSTCFIPTDLNLKHRDIIMKLKMVNC